MPPKRKRTTDSTLTNNKQIKTSTAKNHRSHNTTKAKLAPAPTNFSVKKCEQWYKKYMDKEDPDANITPEGMQAFYNDIQVPLESIYPILIGWKMNATRLGYFTKQEWMAMMSKLQVDSVEQLKSYLPTWKKSVENDLEFKQMYQYTFNFAKTTGQKSMDVDIALALWALLLGDKYSHIPSIIEFIQNNRPVKVINKDQWSSLLDFVKTVPYDLQGYDSTSSWPVLFDDYAHWRLYNRE